MKKKTKIIGGSALGLIVVLSFVSYLLMGRAIKLGIETLGPKITKTSIDVGMVTMSPLTGSAKIRNLVVGNPKGFEEDFAVKLGKFKAKVQLSSLAGDVVVIDHLEIIGPEIVYESTKAGNNIKTIQRNVARFVPESKGKKEDEKETRIFIRKVVLRDGAIHWKPRFLNEAKEIPLPGLELSNVGNSEKTGTTPDKVVSTILSSMTSGIGQAVKEASKGLGKGLKKGGDAAGKKLKGLFGK